MLNVNTLTFHKYSIDNFGWSQQFDEHLLSTSFSRANTTGQLIPIQLSSVSLRADKIDRNISLFLRIGKHRTSMPYLARYECNTVAHMIAAKFTTYEYRYVNNSPNEPRPCRKCGCWQHVTEEVKDPVCSVNCANFFWINDSIHVCFPIPMFRFGTRMAHKSRNFKEKKLEFGHWTIDNEGRKRHSSVVQWQFDL